MTIAVMLYAVLIATLAAIAARTIEWIGRAADRPVRWVWLGAILLTLALTAIAPFRLAPAAGVVDTVRLPAATASAPVAEHTSTPLAARMSAMARSALVAPIERVLIEARARSSATGNVVVALFATVASLGLFLTLVAVNRRVRSALARWPTATIAGHAVRVSDDVGPLVIGYARGAIVVPRWVLERSDTEQSLVIAHEAEHVHARDPLLFGAACVATALMPWNPAAWYLASRLRLAVELDCDARLLRRGAAARSYGALLIDVAERASPFRLTALAFADGSTHLHQRILAMQRQLPKFAALRGTVAAVLALAALVAACESKLPTESDVANMDAASATKSLTSARALHDSVVYLVDGALRTAFEAQEIAPNFIGSMSIVRTKTGVDTILMRTLRTARTIEGSENSARVKVLVDSAQKLQLRGRGRVMGDGFGQGLAAHIGDQAVTIMIDGVLSTKSAMASLNRDDIKSIEVIKGPTAARENPTIPNADRGLVKIVTFKGASK